jgi:hypothetical protein
MSEQLRIECRGDVSEVWKGDCRIAQFYGADAHEDALKHLRSKQPPSGETVRVRIAVAVDDRGWWAAFGTGCQHGNQDDDSMKAEADTSGMGREVWHFIEADMPIPAKVEPQVIEGTVTE